MAINLPNPSGLGLLGLVISPLALLFGYLRYRTKTGIRIHGAWGTRSTISCEDTYVHSVILENQKDRASTIFAIYLRLGYNYYIEIEDFRHSPLILKAFETYHKEYDPIDFYSVSMKRIKLDNLLRDPKVPKRLYLATSQGKYRVPRPYKHWDPVVEFFSNHSIGVIHQARSTYKGKAYGSNVIFLVELIFNDGTSQLVPIHARDFKGRIFKGFRFTEDSLSSKEKLETFLKQQQTEGNFTVTSFQVHHLKEWRDKVYDEERPVIEAKKLSRFDVYVLVRIFTYLSGRKLRRANKLAAQKQKQMLLKAELDEEEATLESQVPEKEESKVMTHTSEELFKRWVEVPIEELRKVPNGDGAFAVLAISLGLYERYIDSALHKAGVKADPPNFFKMASDDLKVSVEIAERFWNGYRLGLMHAFHPKAYVQDKGQGAAWGWDIAGDEGYEAFPILEQRGDKVFVVKLNPWKFTDHVLSRWRENPALMNELDEFAFGKIGRIETPTSPATPGQLIPFLPAECFRTYSETPTYPATGNSPGQ